MNRKYDLGRLVVFAAFVISSASWLSGCKKKRVKSGAEAALSVRVIAMGKSPVAKVVLLIRPKNGAALTSTVVMDSAAAIAGLEHDVAANQQGEGHEMREGSALFRVDPGFYTVELRAFNQAGMPVAGCLPVLTNQHGGLLASKGRVRNDLVAVECKGARSPLDLVNQAPMDLRVQMPTGHAKQQGSFTAGREANFCLSAWDPDQNALRFEVNDKSSTGCQIRVNPVSDEKSMGRVAHAQEQCYTAKCNKDFVGRMEIQARVFDQVWREGSRVDVRGCDTKGKEGNCESASSKSLVFALKFVK